MRTGGQDAAISVGRASDGSLLYRVALDPSELPPVHAHDLENAWDAAREAALAATGAESGWSADPEIGDAAIRMFRFHGRRGTARTDLVLADRDALTWAAAIDRRSRLHTRAGLSILLRLLGLIELLASARWTAPFCAIRRDGARLDRRLLDAAARLPLTAEGRLDETGVRAASLPDAARP